MGEVSNFKARTPDTNKLVQGCLIDATKWFKSYPCTSRAQKKNEKAPKSFSFSMKWLMFNFYLATANRLSIVLYI